MLIRRTLTGVPKCYNVQLCCVVLGLVPDSEMLVLLEQVGPVLLQVGFYMGVMWGAGAEVVEPGNGNHGFVLKLLLAQIFSVLCICFCSEDTSMPFQVCFCNFLDGRHT